MSIWRVAWVGVLTAWSLCMAQGAAVATTVAPAGKPASVMPGKLALYDLATRKGELVAVGELGMVVRSDDGGRSWVALPALTDRSLTSVVFLDERHAVAVGHGGTVLRSEDGGSTWKQVQVPETNQDSLLGVTVLSGGRVIAYGAFGLYIESDDNGVTWTRKTLQGFGDDFDRHISKVVEADDNKLLLVGESGTLATSSDGGANWTKLASPYEGSFFGALIAKDGAWLIYGMRGNIFRSTDAGASWSKIPFKESVAINGGTTAADGRILLACNNGVLASSNDNGKSFELIGTQTSQPLAQARYTDDRSLVYVGYLATARKDIDTRPEERHQ